jgi:hypothetical protein
MVFYTQKEAFYLLGGAVRGWRNFPWPLLGLFVCRTLAVGSWRSMPASLRPHCQNSGNVLKNEVTTFFHALPRGGRRRYWAMRGLVQAMRCIPARFVGSYFNALLDSIGLSPFLIYTPPNALPNLEIFQQMHQLMACDVPPLAHLWHHRCRRLDPQSLVADTLTYCLMVMQARGMSWE